jgi:hypothetical protein
LDPACLATDATGARDVSSAHSGDVADAAGLADEGDPPIEHRARHRRGPGAGGEQQRPRCRVGDVVVLARAVVDDVPAGRPCPTFQGDELAEEPVMVEERHAFGVQPWEELPVDVRLREADLLVWTLRVSPFRHVANPVLAERRTGPVASIAITPDRSEVVAFDDSKIRWKML